MKRGASGLSLVVGVDKPSGITSHDAVNKCRHIFGERRVGHAGTLDPLASGVLPILVGPAARLGNYLTEHDKRYVVRISFGSSTTTDDSQGEVVRAGSVPDFIWDASFASEFLEGIVGRSMQIPPVYSAIKVNGKKSCDEARKGNVIDLKPREIEVYSANLVGIADICEADDPYWDVELHVSKGTYIRALARDIGNTLDVPAHVQALRRNRVGGISIDDCVSLEALSELKERATLDPVLLLNYRFAYANENNRKSILNGGLLAADSLELYEYPVFDIEHRICACTSGVQKSTRPLVADENIAILHNNKLVAIYNFDSVRECLKPSCIFQIGVDRGKSV